MYTTLSPCDMCTGACILYKINRVVIGENKNFVGGEDYLVHRGKEVVVLDHDECKRIMARFIEEKPELWYVRVGYLLFAQCAFMERRICIAINSSLTAKYRNEDISV